MKNKMKQKSIIKKNQKNMVIVRKVGSSHQNLKREKKGKDCLNLSILTQVLFDIIKIFY